MKALLALVCLLCATCGSSQRLPDDKNLESFIQVSSRCVYVDRAFSSDKDVFREELANLDFPPDWEGIVDSLLATYGSDPGFWYAVFTQVAERSRK